MSLDYRKAFEQAINIISTRIKLVLLQIPEAQSDTIQEIRLRNEKPVVIVNNSGSCFLTDKGKLTGIYSENCIKAGSQEVADTLNRACNFSVHSYQQNFNNGFITINGGHRIGVAGTGIFFDNGGFNVKEIGFLNIRIARQIFGVSEKFCKSIMNNSIKSILVAGPPSSGKTTFLRDFAYNISSGLNGKYIRTVVIDERGEFSAPYSGIMQNDLGLNTDVLINYKKSTGVEIAVRSFSPEYIIFDEITSDEDLNAVKGGINSGVRFAVSVHCGDENDLKKRRTVNELLKTDEFSYVILLSGTPEPCTVKKIIKTEIIDNEICWTDIDSSVLYTVGSDDSLSNAKKNNFS